MSESRALSKTASNERRHGDFAPWAQAGHHCRDGREGSSEQNVPVRLSADRSRIGSKALASIFVVMLTGCIGYHAGTGSLYAPDVATVYVPMIESDSYRRDLGERLTEAVVKEIELKTPYKVVSTPNADSILSARLLTDTRKTIIQNGFSDPRVSETELRAEVTWVNRRRQPMVPAQMISIPAELLAISQTSNLIPEAGQSVATSQQQAIQRWRSRSLRRWKRRGERADGMPGNGETARGQSVAVGLTWIDAIGVELYPRKRAGHCVIARWNFRGCRW